MSGRRHLDPTDLAAVRAAVGLDKAGSVLHDVGLECIVIGPDALDALPDLVAGALAGSGAADRPVAVVVDGRPMVRAGVDLTALVVDRLGSVGDVRLVRLAEPDDRVPCRGDRDCRGDRRRAGRRLSRGPRLRDDLRHRQGGEPRAGHPGRHCPDGELGQCLLRRHGGPPRPRRETDGAVPLADRARHRPDGHLGRAVLPESGRIGELCAMFTAPADWRLAAAFGMDPTWDPRVVGLFTDGANALLEAAALATSRDPDAQQTLVELMTLSGLALGIAGKTSPISGTEHTVSHLLDMAAARESRPTGFHGAQVGVAALAVSVAWERVLAALDPIALVERPTPSHERMLARTVDAFGELDPTGTMTDECWAQYRLKLERWEARRTELPVIAAGWAAFRAELGGLLGKPERIAAVLGAAGAAARFEELEPAVGRDEAAWALYNGHLLRDRFSLADLAWFAGVWTPDLVRTSIDEAAAIAAGVAKA